MMDEEKNSNHFLHTRNTRRLPETMMDGLDDCRHINEEMNLPPVRHPQVMKTLVLVCS